MLKWVICAVGLFELLLYVECLTGSWLARAEDQPCNSYPLWLKAL